MSHRENYKLIKVFGVSILIIVFLLLIPSSTETGAIMEKVNGAVIGVFSWMLSFLAYAIIGLIIYAAGILDMILKGGVFYMGEELIDFGWSIFRDVMNMGFILIMLVIAFATIFKIQTYSVKTLLPKLLIAILLVNFSKTICYVVVDFGEVLMNSISTSLSPDATVSARAFNDWSIKMGYLKSNSPDSFFTFSNAYREPRIGGPMTAMIYAMGIHHLDVSLGLVSQNMSGKKAETGKNPAAYKHFNSWEWMLQLVMIIVFLIFVLLIVFGLMLIFLIRKVYIWILIMFSPYTFWTYTVPFLRSALSKWWKQFGGYVFYGPVAFFMMYVSAKFLTEGSLRFTKAPGTTKQASDAAYDFFQNYPIGSLKGEDLFRTIIVCTFLAFAVIFGKKMGVAGAAYVEGVGKKIKSNIASGIQKNAKKHWKKTAVAGVAVAGGTGLAATAAGLYGLSRLGMTMRKRMAARGDFGSKVQDKQVSKNKERVKERGKKADIANSSASENAKDARRRWSRNVIRTEAQRDKKAAQFDKAVNDKKVEEMTTDKKGKENFQGYDLNNAEDLKKMETVLDAMGAGKTKEFFNAMPEKKALKDKSTVAEALRGVEGNKITGRSLKNTEVASNLSLNQIRDINKNGSVKQQESLVDGMRGAFDEVQSGKITGEDAKRVIRNAKNMALDEMKARGENVANKQKDIDKHDVEFKDGKFVLKRKPGATSGSHSGSGVA